MAKKLLIAGSHLQDLLHRDHSLVGGVVVGLQGQLVEVQARAMEILKRPQPWTAVTNISGLPRPTVKESINRIAGALNKLRIPQPQVAIQIHLTPADLPKEGTWLDLPIAIIMLQAAGFLPDLPEHVEGSYVLVGEVGLHGEIRRVRGILSIAEAASPFQTLIVPVGNEKECAVISLQPERKSCQVAAVGTLEEVVEFFRGTRRLENVLSTQVRLQSAVHKAPDFSVIKGQQAAKEAAVIAAAGGHNLLLVGPPGEGKSLLAHAMAGILPPLRPEEVVELTRIYSAAGLLEEDGRIVNRRPFRVVHHSASKEALVGGGSTNMRPGEITLAHLGVLFLDELPEFSRSTLEAIRQPMEDGSITISRVSFRVRLPCRFTLVAAMNPCPCGYYSTDRCTCPLETVHKYQSRISGPLLSRIDMIVEMDKVSVDERFSAPTGPTTQELRAKIQSARNRQHQRFAGTEIPFNAAIPPAKLLEYCQFSPEAFQHYKRLVADRQISTRTTDRLAKVARTVADLDAADQILPAHVDQAARFVLSPLLQQADRL
ncbi:MAG: YifB family Mg chelatase-like AAA ATPase [Thermoguttaceae bacterium]|nr:YifB family Mg chelatase-like AAA ATPase [Thermoguttaceae bacterium]MDW8036761.1 YifB family Mg chelatase-like AAA ATPase [Thermoguttaceae bacterium]